MLLVHHKIDMSETGALFFTTGIQTDENYLGNSLPPGSQARQGETSPQEGSGRLFHFLPRPRSWGPTGRFLFHTDF